MRLKVSKKQMRLLRKRTAINAGPGMEFDLCLLTGNRSTMETDALRNCGDHFQRCL